MSEFKDMTSINKLLGSNPGFVGYGQTETIIDKITKQPRSVLLFDEIEKANPYIFDLFLQLFDEGKLTASDGTVGDFSQALIILTSNLGSKKNANQVNIAANLQSEKASNIEQKHSTLTEIKKFFRPEILNRIDEKIIFNTLKSKDLYQITALKLEKHLSLVEEQGVNVTFDENLVEFITEKYYDPSNGARPIDRGIISEVMNLLAEAMINDEIIPGNQIHLRVSNNCVIFDNLSKLHYDKALTELHEAEREQLQGYQDYRGF